MQVFFFSQTIRGVRYVEVNFAQNVYVVLKKVVTVTNIGYKNVRLGFSMSF